MTGKEKKVCKRVLLELVIPGIVTGLVAWFTWNKMPIDAYVFLNVGGFVALLLIMNTITKIDFEVNDIDKIHEAVSEIDNETIKRKHFIDKSIESADKVISGLVAHLSEDCYERCSQNSDKCKICPRFSKGKCSGLLRHYLYETCEKLREAINESREGKFKLITNIEGFHTLAINHLIGYKGLHYSVVHWIGNEEPPEEKYNFLDYHFLSDLLKKIAKSQNGQNTYFKINKFKIRWLLIGDEKKIMNNYDYIFYTVEDAKKTAKKTENLSLTSNDLDDFFEFYIISEVDYRRELQNSQHLLNPTVKKLYSKDEPNLGLFGDYFMFVEESGEEHGTIYTNQYENNSIKDILTFFENIIDMEMTTKKKYSELYNYYINLDEDYRGKTLPARCDKKR